MSFYSGKSIKTVVAGKNKDISDTVSFILKIKWPELVLSTVSDFDKVLALTQSSAPDIVFLQSDIEIHNFFELISRIRSMSDVPIMVLGENSQVIDKAKAFDLGADDWICPSLNPMEFLARVNALLRRYHHHAENHHHYSFPHCDLCINYDSHEVVIGEKTVRLTPIEYRLLCHLARHQGVVLSYKDLLLCGWGAQYVNDRSYVKKYIYRLRNKLEADPVNPEIFLNARGEGYIFAESPNYTN